MNSLTIAPTMKFFVSYPMSKKIAATIISIALLIVLFIGWRMYQYQQYDVPANFATLPISTQNIRGWKTYHNEHFGFEIKYPDYYFLARTSDFNHTSNFGYILLRQHPVSAEEGKTSYSGEGISLYMYRLGQVTSFGISGDSIKLTKETTADDIAQQFLEDDNRPLVRRDCHRRDINGNNTIICTIRAPGEMPLLTGGIFEVFILGVYEMENGERILARMSNNAGGTPYTGDRALRRDMLRVFHTLRWTSYKTQ